MEFQEDSRISCPKCGETVPAGNLYCGNCGASVTRSAPVQTRGIELEGGSKPPEVYPRYERKLSMIQRYSKLLTSPREAMTDIGLAPDYGGVIVLFVFWTIFGIIGVWVMLSKMQFTGTYGEFVTSGVVAGATIGLVLFPVITIVRWLVKSYLIRHACESENWDFETAASVTGYAYLPNVIFSFVWFFILYTLVPSVVVNTTNLEAALLQLQMYDAQISWLTVGGSLVGTVLVLFWKSYLGGLGAHAGTRERCEEKNGIIMFIVIGFIGLAIDFLGMML